MSDTSPKVADWIVDEVDRDALDRYLAAINHGPVVPVPAARTLIEEEPPR